MLVIATGCASAPTVEPPRTDPLPPVAEAPAAPAVAERPVPYPITYPAGYAQALAAGTRTRSGEPGARYWQQRVDYDMSARLDTDLKTLTGDAAITYHNNAPGALPVLVVNLAQNYHAEGVERVRPVEEVTGGITIESVSVGGQELGPTTSNRQPGYLVEGTMMYVVLPQPVESGSTATLDIGWRFTIPQAGASARMGWEEGQLFYIAYWFPQMAVFDDVVGWHAEPFRGNAEFYSDFGTYEVTIDAPAGWLVMSTGELQNPEEVLAPDVIERIERAESSDDAVRVVGFDGADEATRPGTNGRLQWRFRAEDVRDAAFSVMREYAWDAARTPVGDRDGDGATDYSRVDAFWRQHAVHWDDAWRYAQHSIDFFSRYTGIEYPWSHMSVIEGGGIIGGGMEFPMMTLIGDYNQAGDSALYNVVAHELAHMWSPMILSSNERRYAWFDEGTTSFNENNARTEFFPGSNPYAGEMGGYLQVVRAEMEGPIMRWSDFHYPGPQYGTASYSKPATVLHALRGVLGEETFNRAWKEYYDRWAFKHPYPWDMFNTIEDVAGRDLDWFWRAWYYESVEDGRWFLDQAIEDVTRADDGAATIEVRDLGWVPMPVHLTITRAGGETLTRTVPVDRWLAGHTRATVTVPAGPRVTRVEIDADANFPDIDRANNVWTGR